MKKFSTPVPEAVSNFRLYVVYHRRRVIARKSNNSRGQFSRNFAYRVYTYYCAPRSHTIHVKYVYLDVHIRFRRTSFFFFLYINFLFYFTIYMLYYALEIGYERGEKNRITRTGCGSCNKFFVGIYTYYYNIKLCTHRGAA